MQKKTILQLGVMALFVVIAAGSAQSNYSPSSSSNQSYPSYTPSSSPSMIQKTDFPEPQCQRCHGKKAITFLILGIHAKDVVELV